MIAVTSVAECFSATVFIAGDAARARELCREFCMEGLCVTVTPTTFVYTMGAEEGVAVGLTNYPRFQTTRPVLEATAKRLAEHLLAGLFQGSCMVVGPDKTIWMTRRQGDGVAR